MIRKYKVTDETFVDRVIEALHPNSGIETIGLEAERIDDDLSELLGEEERRNFALTPSTISTADGLSTILAQDILSGEWLTIDVGKEIIVQAVS